MSEATLKSRRQDAGLTQQEVAQLAKCSVAMVALLENGYVPESSEVLGRVVRVIEKREKQSAA